MKLTTHSKQMIMDGIRQKLQNMNADHVGFVVDKFLELLPTAKLDKGTFYNSAGETDSAIKSVHNELFDIDRGMYILFTGTPGATDDMIRYAVSRCLHTNPYNTHSVLPYDMEEKMYHLLLEKRLEAPQKKFKTFGYINKNNSRIRRFILTEALNFEGDPRFMYLKYRNILIKSGVQHAWGVGKTLEIKKILETTTPTMHDRAVLNENIIKYILPQNMNDTYLSKLYEALAFGLGVEDYPYEYLQYKSFYRAKYDSQFLQDLPPEIAEGIRAQYHPDYHHEQVKQDTVHHETKGQKIRNQAAATRAGVSHEFDPYKYDPFQLWVYARGNTDYQKVAGALRAKTKQMADKFPISFNKIGVILDKSISSKGTGDYHPVLGYQVIRDILSEKSNEYIGNTEPYTMVRVHGETNIADSLLTYVEDNPDAIFILTDGYENAKGGRTHEIIEMAKKHNIPFPPVYQITNASSAEAFGIRSLSPMIPNVSVDNKGKSLGAQVSRALLRGNPLVGIMGLLEFTIDSLDIMEVK